MEHVEWEARQRWDMPRLEEGTIQAEDVFVNLGPAAMNSLGRAGKTLLQASLKEKEHRDGGKPLPLHPHADTGNNSVTSLPLFSGGRREMRKKKKPKQPAKD